MANAFSVLEHTFYLSFKDNFFKSQIKSQVCKNYEGNSHKYRYCYKNGEKIIKEIFFITRSFFTKDI